MWRTGAGLFAVIIGSLAALGVIAEQTVACQIPNSSLCLPPGVLALVLVILLVGAGLLARYGGRTDQ